MWGSAAESARRQHELIPHRERCRRIGVGLSHIVAPSGTRPATSMSAHRLTPVAMVFSRVAARHAAALSHGPAADRRSRVGHGETRRSQFVTAMSQHELRGQVLPYAHPATRRRQLSSLSVLESPISARAGCSTDAGRPELPIVRQCDAEPQGRLHSLHHLWLCGAVRPRSRVGGLSPWW